MQLMLCKLQRGRPTPRRTVSNPSSVLFFSSVRCSSFCCISLRFGVLFRPATTRLCCDFAWRLECSRSTSASATCRKVWTGLVSHNCSRKCHHRNNLAGLDLHPVMLLLGGNCASANGSTTSELLRLHGAPVRANSGRRSSTMTNTSG